MADDDDFAFDFEGNLQKEAETYQGASVSFAFFPFLSRASDLNAFCLSHSLLSHSHDLSLSLSTSLASTNTHQAGPGGPVPHVAPGTQLGQSLTNFKKNYRQVREESKSIFFLLFFLDLFFSRPRPLLKLFLTKKKTKTKKRKTVCTYWLKGLCMKGDSCGFLHQFDSERMPTCRAMVKHGTCREPDCPYKHSTEDIKECNMYRLGFCVYGPTCRYKHTRLEGPPPDPSTLEAARPKTVRNVNAVVNSVNIGITAPRMERVRMLKAIEAGGGAGSAAAAAAHVAVQAGAQRRGQQLQLPGVPMMPS